MTTIKITLDLYDEFADPEHEMGITNAGYNALVIALLRFGPDLPEVERVNE